MRGVKEIMDTEKRLKELKTTADSARQQKLRAEMAAETALKERASALQALKDEFDVSDIEAAREKLKNLKAELEESLQEAEKILGDIA